MDDDLANAVDTAPLEPGSLSGASDPMNISVTTFERQFLDFAYAIKSGNEPVCGGEDGYRALQLVLGVYQSCREGEFVGLGAS